MVVRTSTGRELQIKVGFSNNSFKTKIIHNIYLWICLYRRIENIK